MSTRERTARKLASILAKIDESHAALRRMTPRPKYCPGAVALNRDNVNHHTHYTSHPSGVECIEVAEHMGFNLGNAMKYIWRADEKGNALEDLKKAKWHLEREIEKRTRAG